MWKKQICVSETDFTSLLKAYLVLQLLNYKEHIWIIYKWYSLFSSSNLNNNNTQYKFVYAGGWIIWDISISKLIKKSLVDHISVVTLLWAFNPVLLERLLISLSNDISFVRIIHLFGSPAYMRSEWDPKENVPNFPLINKHFIDMDSVFWFVEWLANWQHLLIVQSMEMTWIK